MIAVPTAKQNSEERKSYVLLIGTRVSILKQYVQNLSHLKILRFWEECRAPFKHIL